jgi:hypothetical protein
MPMDMLTLAQTALDPGRLSASERFLERLTSGNMLGWTLSFAFVLALVVVSKTASTIKTIARERTRREIAAFIAEGSITPEQGERLMKAGHSSREC